LCVSTKVVAVTLWLLPDLTTSTTTRKSKWLSLKPAIRRSGVWLRTGNNPMTSGALARRGCFQPKGRYQKVAQFQQRFDPARRASHHLFSRLPGIERAIVDRDAVGIDKLRAGQQHAGVDVRIDLANFHHQPLSVADQFAPTIRAVLR
jgi:hypothetical protein